MNMEALEEGSKEGRARGARARPRLHRTSPQSVLSESSGSFGLEMARQGQRWSVWMLLLGFTICVRGITREELFPFGLSAGDQALTGGNDETRVIQLEKPLTFYDEQFDRVYVNTNGFVSLEKPPVESEYLRSSQVTFKMLAALQGDLDTSDRVGRVFFRQDTNPALLQKAGDHINRAFPEDDLVNPEHLFVVTWVDVASHEAQSRGDTVQRNSFQMVIASMETVTYVILLFPRGSIQFQSSGGHTLHSGFSRGAKRYLLFSTRPGEHFSITDGSEDSVKELTERTNSGRRGVWVYEIGTFPHFTSIAPGEVPDVPEETDSLNPLQHQQQHTVVFPDVSLDGVYLRPEHPSPIPVQFTPPDASVLEIENGDNFHVDVFTYNSGQCAGHKCSKFGECRNFPEGHCCVCKPGFYGNGIHCVPDGVPQRMNGKVSGRVFIGGSGVPVDFTGNDLHSYVVVNDGRAYVAVSAIPPELGFSLQPLATLGGAIGWAFALQQPGFSNGFSVIGGVFQRQVDVVFQPRGEKLSISQQFRGIDEHDHLMVDTRLEGSIPEVPQGTTVQIDPYTQIYQYSTNLITSSSSRECLLKLPDGSSRSFSFTVRETITFQSCSLDEASRSTPATQMLSIDQVFVMYDMGERLLRFAMTNKIGDVNGQCLSTRASFLPSFLMR
ncbi:hypothetical protein DNTS_012936 [Danionella cerebrum]|uniref:EGF-like domain-containing protein n=1 Tax=Danionella cerebrum TaxID=2873325 RepID=A0A553NWN2_9TELE|nr:hypothetical protein DNTS_012936 [Danionella translucida]